MNQVQIKMSMEEVESAVTMYVNDRLLKATHTIVETRVVQKRNPTRYDFEFTLEPFHRKDDG